MAGKPRVVTLENVRQYISAYPGARYTSSSIARHFHAKAQEVTRLCNELEVRGLIKSCVPSTTRMYFISSQAEIDAANQVRCVAPVVALKGYDAMMRKIAANCEAGRR
ncbi:hypothetical protein [Glaciimonas sp. PCH181]|uniref:hypothetical protein n=1 Tax=Glaciimonas sp. PCH181 TaxID=2133943 RepID=UPI000D35664B|nr:hypothetical protein [Glaciimonas sp. PCH181]PUA17286.1 hypothetical protein C7W93_15260 [Glaciimonas sp. PCH181]